MRRRCIAIKADGKQCRGQAFENGLCNVHGRMEADRLKLIDSDSEEVAVIKERIGGDDVRFAARERRRKRFEERNRLGMLPNQKLACPRREGYVRRWANDDGTRIEELLDKGYTHVLENVDGDSGIRSTDQGTRKSQVVGKKADGSPLTAYLMEQEESLYEEDQQAKDEAISRKEEQIRRVVDSKGIGRSAYDPTKGKGQFRVNR